MNFHSTPAASINREQQMVKRILRRTRVIDKTIAQRKSCASIRKVHQRSNPDGARYRFRHWIDITLATSSNTTHGQHDAFCLLRGRTMQGSVMNRSISQSTDRKEGVSTFQSQLVSLLLHNTWPMPGDIAAPDLAIANRTSSAVLDPESTDEVRGIDDDDDAAYRDTAPDDGHRFRAYLSAVRQRQRLDHPSEIEHFERLKHPHADIRAAARSALIEANLWIVPIVVRRFYRHGSGFEDLVAEGNLGLFRALERFDVKRGLRFSTYAKWWITHVVTSAMAASAYPVVVPRRLALRLSKQRRAEAAHGDQPGTSSSASEVAPTAAPLGEPYDQETDQRSEDGPQWQPEVLFALKEGLQLLRSALDELPERERLVIEARYGLNGKTGRTLQDLGSTLGITAEGVRKVQLSAMKKLRQRLATWS
jgi:RNA polymerase sigma factor (sigma-70 family)